MGLEKERKFLVSGAAWKQGAAGVPYRQGYLCRLPARLVRVRLAGERGFLAVKGETRGIVRMEYEYEIPSGDAGDLLREMAEKPLIEKIRYRLPYSGLIWEVDEFLGENQGLVVAEVEVESEDQIVSKPPWAGREVSDLLRYANSSLVEHPFSRWREWEKRGERADREA
ncbi:MAG: CYTH domain-containing protein [Desulfovibrio sp.]|nr:CYTH domain-containing protein [Desulfovibrio sp.]